MANAYASRQNLYDRFEDDVEVAALTDSSTIDTTVIDEVIAHAEGEVDSYLARRYSVPIDVSASTVLAGMLRSKTLDLAVRHLHVRTGSVPQAAEDAYDDALSWLEKVGKGVITLPTDTQLAAPSVLEPDASQGTGATTSTRSSSRRVFHRDTLSNL